MTGGGQLVKSMCAGVCDLLIVCDRGGGVGDRCECSRSCARCECVELVRGVMVSRCQCARSSAGDGATRCQGSGVAIRARGKGARCCAGGNLPSVAEHPATTLGSDGVPVGNRAVQCLFGSGVTVTDQFSVIVKIVAIPIHTHCVALWTFGYWCTGEMCASKHHFGATDLHSAGRVVNCSHAHTSTSTRTLCVWCWHFSMCSAHIS